MSNNKSNSHLNNYSRLVILAIALLMLIGSMLLTWNNLINPLAHDFIAYYELVLCLGLSFIFAILISLFFSTTSLWNNKLFRVLIPLLSLIFYILCIIVVFRLGFYYSSLL